MTLRLVWIGAPAALLLGLALPCTALGQPERTVEQELMHSCNADAGARELTGEARQTFMSRCMAGLATPSAGASLTPGSPTPAQAAQHARMRDCNAESGARELAGEARRTFMSACLAGSTGSGATATGGGTTAPRN